VKFSGVEIFVQRTSFSGLFSLTSAQPFLVAHFELLVTFSLVRDRLLYIDRSCLSSPGMVVKALSPISLFFLPQTALRPETPSR
jgi:hypothetical protein